MTRSVYKQILYKLKLKTEIQGKELEEYYSTQPNTRRSIRALIAQKENGKFNWGLHRKELVSVEQYEVTTKHLKTLSIEEFKELKDSDDNTGTI